MDIRTGLNPDGYWFAIDADTYDADCDQDGFFSASPVGYGKSEQAAIDDLYSAVGWNRELIDREPDHGQYTDRRKLK